MVGSTSTPPHVPHAPEQDAPEHPLQEAAGHTTPAPLAGHADAAFARCTRRDFLSGMFAAGTAVAALSTLPGLAFADDALPAAGAAEAFEGGQAPPVSVGPMSAAGGTPAADAPADPGVGSWARDGRYDVAIPASSTNNASALGGMARELNGSCFPADDATPIPPLEVPAKWDKECEICVIGAGGGGLNAASRAAEMGAATVCVEAMSLWGGNAQSAGMCGIFGGMKMQDERRFGFPKWPFDPKDLTDYALEQYHYAMDPDLLYLIADQGHKALDWMADCGVEWRLGAVPVYVAPKNSTLDHHVLKMRDATDAMFEFASAKGCEFVFSAPARALVQDADGRIVGVRCDTIDGPLYIHATKAVIMTAGGFCNNKALLEKYCPTAAMACASNYLIGEEKGECMRMGLGVGADVSGFNSSASFDGGVDWQAEGAMWGRFLYDGMTQLSRQPWLTIDRSGQRVRYLDSNVAKDGPNAIYALGDLATLQMARPGHRSYVIFDSTYEEHVEGFDQEHCRMLIEPGMEQEDKIPEHFRNWRNGVDDALAADVLKRRDSLEALERDLGLAEGVLTEAVAHWNENCEKGADDYLYPLPSEWLHPIATPPFYGCRVGGNLYGTKAGLMVNTKMQVLDTKGLPIPGLYAGWHTAGGACGENSYIGQPVLGSIMGDVGLAFCGGYLAGGSAVECEIG
ncbi:MAG: FAD-binding protein [Coriobacteriales bacterium]|jgi:hypothetical protein|nr:FAD-binding protein [Coriobacteriales bacterium]